MKSGAVAYELGLSQVLAKGTAHRGCEFVELPHLAPGAQGAGGNVVAFY
jgi:hypothetical protein